MVKMIISPTFPVLGFACFVADALAPPVAPAGCLGVACEAPDLGPELPLLGRLPDPPLGCLPELPLLLRPECYNRKYHNEFW